MAENSRKTSSPSVLTLTDVTAEPADGTPTHYLLPAPENGYVAASSVEVLSQFDLGKLGFSIIKDDPESFQLLDAENQPQNVVKGIFEKLKAAAEDDPVFSNALASHKYKQLLDVIDQNNDGYYSVDEYRNAVHNPAYRDPLYQLIVQHPSEWYYEKTDGKWTKYLEKLEPDASKWKKYTEAFLDKMIWMKKVAGMGPAPWHMHPVMFMGALASDDGMDLKWLLVPKGQLTFDAEGNDIESSPWFSRKVHWPGGVSGITIGRGYDLGQNNSSNNELTEVGVDENLKSWLVGSQSMSGATASTRLNGAPTSIRQFQITRKQQYDLFIITYQKLEDDVKRICQKTATIQAYHPNKSVTSDQAWDDIPQKIKEILVDLRYRGDYTPTIRSHLQHAAYAGDLSTFGSVLSNSSLWGNVPNDRFQRRVHYYEHN